MNRMLASAVLLLLAMTASAADRFAPEPEEFSIATTARIVKIDLKGKTLKVRSSDAPTFSVRNVSQNFSQMMAGLKQKIGVTLPGGITIALPGHNGKTASKPPEETSRNNPDEFMVIVTKDTVFQDGDENIRLEDFRPGETISIHGVQTGAALRASRIAKWF